MLSKTKHTFLQNFISKLNYFNYSKNTVKIYSYYVEEFLRVNKKSPSKLDSNDFKSYLENYNFSSISQQNQIISSIKFLYKKVLNKKYDKVDFSRPRKEKKLPQIIDKKILTEKILSIKNMKHKAILSAAYSCGLRVSEIINLKIENIDSNRGLIHIIQAKGKKDRVVPLSNGLLKTLRDYFKKHRPKEYLFNGQSSLQYSATSCNKIIKKYIKEDAYMHQLRHSCFTHLLEGGTDLRIIQSIAGHQSSKTTEIYTHVSKNHLSKIQMPI
jgi:site-specific recombinase XerD